MDAYSSEKHENGLLVWRISRPEKRNAINYEVMDGLELMLNEAERDPSIKAVAITGEGDHAFCSGGDVVQFHHLKTEKQAYAMLSRMGNLLYRLAVLPKPTIAVLNGLALGGGCELATACDMRIAKAGTGAGFIQANLAITTGWGGASLLYEKMDPSRAMQILTKAQILSVEELKNFGFINEIYEESPLQALEKFMEDILSKEAGVLKSYKESMIEKFYASNLKQRMDQEIERCAVLWVKDEHHQVVSSFLKR